MGCNGCRRTLGGKVEPAQRREYGFAQLEIYPSTTLLKGIESPLRVWNSHGDHVAEVPPGFSITGRTENAISVIENPAAGIYALEFHPEVRHTAHGSEILSRFVRDVAGIQPNWFPRSFIEETVDRVRREVKGRSARCAHCRAGWIPRSLRRWWEEPSATG